MHIIWFKILFSIQWSPDFWKSPTRIFQIEISPQCVGGIKFRFSIKFLVDWYVVILCWYWFYRLFVWKSELRRCSRLISVKTYAALAVQNDCGPIIMTKSLSFSKDFVISCSWGKKSEMSHYFLRVVTSLITYFIIQLDRSGLLQYKLWVDYLEIISQQGTILVCHQKILHFWIWKYLYLHLVKDFRSSIWLMVTVMLMTMSCCWQ